MIVAVLVWLGGCSEPGSDAGITSAHKPVAVASNYPLFYFASEIAGGGVDVRFPQIEGDPANWIPDGDDVGLLQQADLLILNGAGYEPWLSFVTLPESQMLDTTAAMAERLIAVEDEVTHQHGPAGQHSHKGTAFTTWLDPTLAVEQAGAIASRLSELVPEQRATFELNLGRLQTRLMELDAALEDAFAAVGGQPLIFSHPVYQYLQRRYDLNGRSLHWEPDVEPGTRDWIEFGNLRSRHPASLLLWEEEALEATVQELARAGVGSAVFRPVANRPAEGDFLSGMAANIARLRAAPVAAP
jgi:zinc transport system substrate-binding protein